jgi:hypothetical protein
MAISKNTNRTNRTGKCVRGGGWHNSERKKLLEKPGELTISMVSVDATK